MGPRTEDQPHRCALPGRQAKVILDRRPRIGIVSAGEVNDRHIGVAVVIAFGLDPGPLPEIVEYAARPLLEEVVRVFRSGAHRRPAFAPRDPREPRLDVLRRERGPDGRILGVGERAVVGPGRLLQVEGAAVTDAAPVGVRKPAAIEKLRGEAGHLPVARKLATSCAATPAAGEGRVAQRESTTLTS